MRRELDEFLCPISMSVMEDPVVLVETGVTYERLEIAAWFAQGKNTCPCTGVTLSSQQLVPNRALKSTIERWKRGEATFASQNKSMRAPKRTKKDIVRLCFPFLKKTKSTETTPRQLPHTAIQITPREIANQMTLAVRKKDEPALIGFKQENWSYDVLDDSGRGAIHFAAIQDDSQMMNVLLSNGASPDFKDKSGCTALHWAARLGNYSVCKVLLQSQARVNATNLAKTTPLHMAAFWGSVNIVVLLVSEGANLYALNEKNQRPLDSAKQSPWDSAKETAKLLVQYEALKR